MPSHLSFDNWPQNIVRTLILSVVMSGAVGKPVGNRSNVRQSCHPRTFSPIVCEISHDSRDHAALCSALAHIHSVTVRGPRWPWPLGLIALPLPLPPSSTADQAPALGPLPGCACCLARIPLTPLKSAQMLLSRFLAQSLMVVGTQEVSAGSRSERLQCECGKSGPQ